MLHPVIAFLSLGSNVGDRAENLRQGSELLRGEGIALRRVSSIYETAPVDNTDQGWFLNCVVEISTSLEPLALLRRLQAIENHLGRERAVPKGPRTLDIDILLYGDLLMENAELTLPHPSMRQRRFVLEPLCELAPTLRLPGSGITVEQALRQLHVPALVRRLETAPIKTQG